MSRYHTSIVSDWPEVILSFGTILGGSYVTFWGWGQARVFGEYRSVVTSTSMGSGGDTDWVAPRSVLNNI